MIDTLWLIQWIIAAIVAALVLIPLTLAFVLLMFAAQAATSWVGQCRSCGYDLRGLGASDRRSCPECGQPFIVDTRGDVIS